MKISKSLNKKNFLLLFLLFFFNSSIANEPADIWNIDKTKTDEEQKAENTSSEIEETSEEIISVFDLNNQKKDEQNKIFSEHNIENKISLFGLYDPDEHNLSIEMWNDSDGEEIKKISDKILSQNLSGDALEILKIALLTNSNVPTKNITNEDFYNFQKNFLIKNSDLDLIKEFIEKNQKFSLLDDLINYYANYYLAEANIQKTCEIFESIDEVTLKDNYSSKLKIYCLINANKIDQAILIYELKKEQGLIDNFFEKKNI